MTRINGRAPGRTSRHRGSHDVTFSGSHARQGYPPYFCAQCGRWYQHHPTTSSR